MNTTNAVVMTGGLAVLGRWSEGDGVDVRLMVAIVILALMLSSFPEKIAQPLAYLMLAAVLFKYGPAIIDKTGVREARPKKPKGVIPGHHFTRSKFRQPPTGSTGVTV